ncbi:hypothetical protein HRE53_29625 (plasmid) [Acaryochloris sp. 'Moss Beach']|uniref:hypothetical protein n=1 Tax=Acaryochloris sp. 'Moss Beach' TaxID=2740837 RepID=UPI001F1FC260|nr:hypothetical protein [Acaryochloris sp. 'Moss Beach']UJB72773.1 hypothetical protein HRE53_29625 [Acaryochloris sp. 'Moss Beach']
MLTELGTRTVPRQPRILEELGSTLKFVLGGISVSCVVFGLLTVSPYLIDSKCSRFWYVPVTLAECLPESEVKSTTWEASIPTPVGDFYLAKGEPIAQVFPQLFSLWLLSFPTVVATHALGRFAFVKLALTAAQSHKSQGNKQEAVELVQGDTDMQWPE